MFPALPAVVIKTTLITFHFVYCLITGFEKLGYLELAVRMKKINLVIHNYFTVKAMKQPISLIIRSNKLSLASKFSGY